MTDRHFPSPYPSNAAAPAHDSYYASTPYQLGYGNAQDEQEGINPLRLFAYVINYRWLIAGVCVVGLALGLVATMMQTPQYRSTARLEIMAPSTRIIQELELVSQSADIKTFMTAREKLRSRTILTRVVHQLGLADRAEFLFPAPEFSFSNILDRAFGISSAPELHDHTPEERESMAIGRVEANLNVELVTNTSLLAISYTDQNPRIAAEIANQIAQSYIDQRVDQTSRTLELTRQFIEDQVLQVKGRFRHSQAELVAYARDNNITLSGDQTSLISAQISSINQALSETIEERLDNQLLVEQIHAGRAESLDQVLNSEGLQRLNGQIAGLRGEYQQKLSTFKPGFPEMRQLQAQIDELQRQYQGGVTIIAQGIQMRLDDSVTREAELRQKLAELEAEQIEFQDKNIQYTILQREVDSNRSQYDSLIATLNQVGVGSELRNNSSEITEVARAANFPYTPRLSLNLAIAFALSGALTAALIYLLELLNNRFSNPDQVEKELNTPMLGILPRVEQANFASLIADPRSGLSEAYRTLRTSLQLSRPEGAPRTLAITSAEPAEGKSTTAMKLARDFAVLGQNVALVDADMRKPNLHQFFGISNTMGLSNILTNTLPPGGGGNVIRRVGDDNVWIITSGALPPNPADLLSSPRMALILQQLSRRFDMVIIDTPPVVGLADAALIARMAEGTLMIVSCDQVTRKAGALAIRRLRSAGAQILGATMSKFSVSKLDYADAYQYMNSDYYGYGMSGETPRLAMDGPPSVSRGSNDTSSKIVDAGSRIRTAFGHFRDRFKPDYGR